MQLFKRIHSFDREWLRKDTLIIKGWKITVLAFKIQNHWCRKTHFFLYRGIGAYDII